MNDMWFTPPPAPPAPHYQVNALQRITRHDPIYQPYIIYRNPISSFVLSLFNDDLNGGTLRVA